MFLYTVQREYFTFSLSNQLLYCIVLVSISSISTSVMLQGVEPHVILAGGGGGCGKRVVSLSLFIPAGHHTLVRLLSTQLALLQSVVVFFLFLDVGVGCRLDSPSKPPRKHRRTAMGAESSAQRDVTASEEEKDASAAEGGCVLDSKVRHASLGFFFFLLSNHILNLHFSLSRCLACVCLNCDAALLFIFLLSHAGEEQSKTDLEHKSLVLHQSLNYLQFVK